MQLNQEKNPVLQRVVAGDGEVEAGLVDGCGLSVERHHRGWTEQFGIEEFKDIWRQRRVRRVRFQTLLCLHEAERSLGFCQVMMNLLASVMTF